MEKTRNFLVLKGSKTDVDSVLGNFQFKGLTEFTSSMKVTPQAISNEFENNKSIICCIPEEFIPDNAIEINIINSSDDIALDEDKDYINIANGSIPQQLAAIADKYKLDIGDHKSNSSGLNGAPKASDCPYCIYINNNYVDKDLDNLNRTIYKSENFFVMPTVGEFIKGYLLIIPNEHVMSMAEIPSNQRQELLDVIDDVQSMIKLTYPVNDVLVWENGTGNGGKGKAKNSIVHSHVHVAPSKLTPAKIQELQGFPLVNISYEDLFAYGNHSYLLIKGDSNDDWWINDNPDLYIPRQHIRQLVADEYKFTGDTWNWRTNPFVYLIKATVDDIQNALIQNWNSLPARIKNNTKNFFSH